MDKVKLPKQVAAEIEALRLAGASNIDIICEYASGKYYSLYKALTDFASDNFDLFLEALVNGYGVGPTPEEKVYEYYYEHTENSDEKVGVCRTLNLLGIKIKGVNT